MSAYNGEKRISYTYDENGLRTSKTVGGVTTKFVYDNTLLKAQYTDDYSMLFWYDENSSPIGFVYTDKTTEPPTSQTFFYGKNAFGDIRSICDETGKWIASYWYNEWGQWVDAVWDTSEELYQFLLNNNPLLYRGYYYDTETGYYYLQSRYYNPEWHRFINADDPNKIGETQTPLSVNAYAYCENDPINLTDESGCASISLVGVGLQIELSLGRGTVGTELIWYTKSSIHKGRARYMPYVYLYTDFGVINQ